MASMLEKSSDKSRALLFGLLVNCIFARSADTSCPLWELRNNLSIDEKYKYVMELADEVLRNILLQHEKCYENKMSKLEQY
jgi:hypothetical protein